MINYGLLESSLGKNIKKEDYDYLNLTIGELKDSLSKLDSSKQVLTFNTETGKLSGLGNVYHTYRGDYTEGAISEVETINAATVSELTSLLEKATKETQEGYKGGDYNHYDHTDVYLANYGQWSQVALSKLITYELGGTTHIVMICSYQED